MNSASLASILAGMLYTQATPAAEPGLDLAASMLPSYLYDARESPIPRRRPGHPYPEGLREDQNPGHVDPAPVDLVGEFVPVPDRWRLMETLGLNDNVWNPYVQNTLKGDKPIRLGEDWFFSLIGISDTIIEPRSVPTPVGPQSSADPGANDIFSGIDQTIFAQTLLAGIVYFKGNTVFKPPEWEYRLTLAAQYNRVEIDDVRGLFIDPRRGRIRNDTFIGVQEAFIDRHLRDVSDRYDFDAFRIGIQPFSTDFRGFLFQDLQLGARLFGNRDNNRRQYNIAWFRRVEKDTNSGLNDIFTSLRDDDVFVVNYYWQDLGILGFTSQAILAWNRNREDDFFFDANGFLARPASLGVERNREYDAYYVGYNGDGRIGQYNLSASLYYLFGSNESVFTGRKNDIRAGFAAFELSRDFSWIRPRLSVLYASGDSDPFDDVSGGYDAIFENPIFAGADTSYWIRQNQPLIGGGGVALAGRNGVLPSLRSSKELGQSNFDNPGIRLIGVGADFDLTPQSRVSVNLNQLWFDDTATLELARNQTKIKREIGTDFSVAWIWRPYMHQNLIIRLSGALLEPGDGLANLYGSDDTFYTVLGNIVLNY